jgi:hypothetical protein
LSKLIWLHWLKMKFMLKILFLLYFWICFIKEFYEIIFTQCFILIRFISIHFLLFIIIFIRNSKIPCSIILLVYLQLLELGVLNLHDVGIRVHALSIKLLFRFLCLIKSLHFYKCLFALVPLEYYYFLYFTKLCKQWV